MERKWWVFLFSLWWGLGLWFFFLAGVVLVFFISFFVVCVVEGAYFDTQCLLDFLRHGCLYGISLTSVSAVVELRDGKGSHAKTQSAD